MQSSKEKTSALFLQLLETMETLRGPEGCPWDKAQTPPDLNTHLLEETYEVLEAVDSKKPDRLQEELGDLLLQIIFHSQMAKEKNEFDIADVLQTLTEKLIRRHPHVFQGLEVKGVHDVLKNWEKIKMEEKQAKGLSSLLSDIPSQLPALQKAYRLGEKASRVGFDWPHTEDVLKKVEEEIRELTVEMKQNKTEKISEEFGDVLFSLAQLARFLKINPEESLRHACQKFIQRFQKVETELSLKKKSVSESNFEELNLLWEAAKKSTQIV